MLAFLKKWRKAYLEDKGDRLHAQVEAERNILCQKNALNFDDVAHSLSERNDFFTNVGEAFDEQHHEYCRRGYYS